MAERPDPRRMRKFDLLLIGHTIDGDALQSIASSLREFGIEARVLTLDPTRADLGAVGPSTEAAGTIAMAFGSVGLTDVLRKAWSQMPALGDRPRFAVLLPGAPPDHAKELGVQQPFQVDLSNGISDERRLKAFATQLSRLRDAAPAEAVAAPEAGAPPEAARTSEAPSAPTPPPTPPPTPKPTRGARRQADDTLGWDQLDDDAMAALAVADAVRAATSQTEVHMEHVLAGLYRQDPGPLRQATAAAGVSETALRTILNESAKAPLPGDADLHVPPLDRLPRLSGHSRVALVAARGLAGQRDSARIETRHLTVGALSISDCDPISKLRAAGVDPEQALAWDQPLTAKAAAQTDQPTLDDLLGYSSLVDALAELITAPETTFPLAIGISAPWGGGKSSVMRMLHRRLPAMPKRQSLIRRFQRWVWEADEGRPPAVTVDPATRWVLVDFPAWRYDTGEQLWAAMAKVTFDAARAGVGWWGQLRLRWVVERPRIPVWSTVLRVAFAGLGGALGYVGGVFVGSLAGPQINDTTAGVVGGIGGAAALARAFWQSASDPFKRAVESIAAQPGIAAGDGFSPDEERRIRALMKVLLTERAGVVTFIDDLDRCTPRNLVRVIEVVNQIFVASSYAAASDAEDDPGVAAGPPEPGPRRLVFVMGMDREVVARGIEAEYEKLLQHLAKGDGSNRDDFGLAFLDKIIQLWVTLPTPSPAGLDRLLQEAAGIRPPPDPKRDAQVAKITQTMRTGIAGIPESDRPRLNAALNRIVEKSSEAERTAARIARAEVRSSLPTARIADDPRLWAALKIGADCLEPNPRQRKRFNNAFRLQFYLAQDLSLGRDQYAALAKLVAIRLRWPRLAHALDEDHPYLLKALERRANAGSQVNDLDEAAAAAQEARTEEWFDEKGFPDLPDLYKILKVDPPERTLSSLPDEDIPRVA
jgi:hypothetical protein